MILVTGATGYIGSHCVLNLLTNGYNVVALDNLSSGNKTTINKLKKHGELIFYEADILNKETLNNIFLKHNISSVFHFAACSCVEESQQNPQKYYKNNVEGTICLLNAMVKNNVKKIIFSSSASIYGSAIYVPIDEKHPKNPINNYGKTKLFIENVLCDYDRIFGLKSVCFRYFNAIGASDKELIGELHNPETHILPNIIRTTFLDDGILELFGDDYNTKDGTCIRDYVDVDDIVRAHILALDYLQNNNKSISLNLGCRAGISIKELIKLCEETLNKKINVKISPRRMGDCAELVADSRNSEEILNWTPKKDIKQSIISVYKWEKYLKNNNKI